MKQNPKERRTRVSVAVGLLMLLVASLAHGDGGVQEAMPVGIGVNFFDGFTRLLAKDIDSVERDLDVLRDFRVPFVRVSFGGQWPVDWELYRQDRRTYYETMERFIGLATERGIRVLPVLFWRVETVPDLLGEPLGDWGKADSDTTSFARQYVREVVGRFRGEAGIIGWECFNEFNLKVDLPNFARVKDKKLRPALGTPSIRGEADYLTTATMKTAMEMVAGEIRRYDATRFISTGNSLPRASAWHNANRGTWGKDNPAQFRISLLAHSPSPTDMVSIHVYPRHDGLYFGSAQVSIAELIAEVEQIASEEGRGVFVGEFGAALGRHGIISAAQEHAVFVSLLDAVKTMRRPFGALWVYAWRGRGMTLDPWEITGTNRRAYQLQLIRDANEEIGKRFRQ